MNEQQIVNKLNELERRIARLETEELPSPYKMLERNSSFGMVANRIVRGQDARYINRNYIEDFSHYPISGWQFAGSPFVVLKGINVRYNTILYGTLATSGGKAFYYRDGSSLNGSNTVIIQFLPFLNVWSGSAYAGLRLDDGTDDNYIEFVVSQSFCSIFQVKAFDRRDGGNVTEAAYQKELITFPSYFYVYMSGNRPGYWRTRYGLVTAGSNIRFNIYWEGMAWGIARVGLVTYSSTDTANWVGIDFIAW